jgi:hypothetical protein
MENAAADLAKITASVDQTGLLRGKQNQSLFLLHPRLRVHRSGSK